MIIKVNEVEITEVVGQIPERVYVIRIKRNQSALNVLF